MKLTLDPIPDASGFFTLRHSDASENGNLKKQPVATAYAWEDGENIARATTACHGLDLPADVPPGVLAELVTGSGDMLSALDAGDLASAANAAQSLRSILAKLTPTPDPAKP